VIFVDKILNLMQNEINQALTILKNGGIILYPTDTIWGIGCDATNVEAVKKIYLLKQREEKKSMLVLVDEANRIGRYVKEVPEMAAQLIEVNDKPMTIIYPGAINLASNLIGEDKTIGIRIVQDEFCQKLISRLNRPLVSTSANISGQASPAIFEEISNEIKQGVDYIVNWRQDDNTKAAPSSIIKVGLGGQIEIIRK
jgi:L-threonylcarbamoyladenylate synthase